MNILMEGWVDGRMDGWKNGWMEECMMGGPIDDTNGRQTDRQMEGRNLQVY